MFPNFTVRKLAKNDLTLIEDMLNHQDMLFGLPKRDDTNSAFLSALEYRLTKEPQSIALFGVLLSNQLIAMAGGIFAGRLPLWTLCYVHVRKGTSHYLQTTGKAIDALIEYAEGLNIYNFDFAIALRPIQGYDPTALSSRLTRLSEKAKRYHFYTEAIVEKNTQAHYEYHWIMLGQKVHQTDMLIRNAELKEEFRVDFVKKIQSAAKCTDVQDLHSN